MADDELRRLERLAPTDPLAAERLAAARARTRVWSAEQRAGAAAAVQALEELQALCGRTRGDAQGATLAEAARGWLRLGEALRAQSLAMRALDLPVSRDPRAASRRLVAAAVLERVGEVERARAETEVVVSGYEGNPSRHELAQWGLPVLAAWRDRPTAARFAARLVEATQEGRMKDVADEVAGSALRQLGLVQSAASKLRVELSGKWAYDAFAALRRLELAVGKDAVACLEGLGDAASIDMRFDRATVVAALDLAPESVRARCLTLAAGRPQAWALTVQLAQLERDLRDGHADRAALTPFLEYEVVDDPLDDVFRAALAAVDVGALLKDDADVAWLAQRALERPTTSGLRTSGTLEAVAQLVAGRACGPDVLATVTQRALRLATGRGRGWWLGLDALGRLAELAGGLARPASGGEGNQRVWRELVAPAVEAALVDAGDGHGHQEAVYFIGALQVSAATVATSLDEPRGSVWRVQAEHVMHQLRQLDKMDLATTLAKAAAVVPPAERVEALAGSMRICAQRAPEIHGELFLAGWVGVVTRLVDVALSLHPDVAPVPEGELAPAQASGP